MMLINNGYKTTFVKMGLSNYFIKNVCLNFSRPLTSL